MSVKMTRYKRAEFEDEDSSSVGSVQVSEGVTAGTTHIRYHPGSTLWKARSLLEKLLFVLCCVLLLVIFVLGAVLSSVGNQRGTLQVLHINHEQHQDKDVCVTPACVKVAASILTSMDSSQSPCDNFYQYACGGWIKTNPIPEGKSIWGTFGKLWQQNQIVMKNVLEKPAPELPSEAEKKVKIYYTSCLDPNETMEALGPQPLLNFLEKVGGWNVTGAFDVETWSLQNTIQVLQNKYNMGGLFSWAVGEDDKNSSLHIIQVDQGGLTLPTRDYYLNKTGEGEVLKAYLEYMTQVAVLMGGDANSSRSQMEEIIEFETRLAEITVPDEERRDEELLYHQYTMEKLQEEAGFINWIQYFNYAFREVNLQVAPSTTIVVYAPDYLQNLTTIVKEYLATPSGKTILNNYLVWQSVRSLTSCLSKNFRDAQKILRKALIGTDGGEETWRYCVSDTNNVMGYALGAMFVREVFHGDAKPMAEEMIESIRTAFKKNLAHLDWMDDETRKAAESKADAITDMIGFPDYILEPDQLNEKYASLEVKENEYFQNNIRVNQYSLRKNLERLNQPVNKTRWGMTPPVVNAYYTPTKNQIVFPAGILQAPFYDTKYPKSLNFGAMGVVMGHELTHAFDDQGREYDKYGNLHQWWNNKTIEKFKVRAECLVKQYSTYTANDDNVNGKQTLGENIADNGGLQASFNAYVDWVKDHKEEAPLPGVNLTHRQLFFLGFAQVWCSSSTAEALHLQVLNDAHSPPQFRVMGPLSNSKDFNREYGCPSGSKMNPPDKCEVW